MRPDPPYTPPPPPRACLSDTRGKILLKISPLSNHPSGLAPAPLNPSPGLADALRCAARFTCRVYSLLSLFLRGAMLACQLVCTWAEGASSNPSSTRCSRWLCTIWWGRVSLKAGPPPAHGIYF